MSEAKRMSLPFKDMWLGLIIAAAIQKVTGFHGRLPYVPSTRERKRAAVKDQHFRMVPL